MEHEVDRGGRAPDHDAHRPLGGCGRTSADGAVGAVAGGRGSGIPPEPTALVSLQRAAGNRAVQRAVQQEAVAQRQVEQQAGGHTATAPPPVAVQRDGLRFVAPTGRYVLTLDGQSHDLAFEQAKQVLLRMAERYGRSLQNSYGAMSDYNRHVRLGRDMPRMDSRGLHGAVTRDEGSLFSDGLSIMVAEVSEFVGGTEFPGPEIYADAQEIFDRMIAAIAAGDLATAFQLAERFEAPFNQGNRAWRAYREAAMGGAESTITGLTVTRDVSFAIVATWATGGIATSLTPTLGAVGAATVAAGTTGAGTALVGAAARETGELAASGDTEVDWARAGEEIVFSLAAGALTGAAGKWLEVRMLSRLFQARWFQMAVFRARMATDPTSPILRGGVIAVDEYLSRNGPQIVSGTIGMVATAAADVARELAHDRTPTEAEFWAALEQKLSVSGFADVVWRVIAASYGRAP